MSELIDIILPSGEPGTVPKADYEAAIAAGAKPAPVAPKEAGLDRPIDLRDVGLGLVQEGTTAHRILDRNVVAPAARFFGAGSSATVGRTDKYLADGAYIVGGEKLHKGVLDGLNIVKKAHPYQYMAGEGAGLFLGPVGELGEVTEAATLARTGEGLLGRVAGMGARGAVEGAAIGAQHQITEDTLEDHDLIGQQIFASAGKDALLGGAGGAALGAGGYYLGKAGGLLSTSRGPAADAVLDEVTGAPGVGKVLRQDAKAAEGLIGDLQNAGATSEQAARMADEVNNMSRAGGGAGPLSGALDGMAGTYIAKRAGTNEEMAGVLAKGYTERATRLAEQQGIVDRQALKLKAATDRVLTAERAMDEAQFLQRPDRMAKLIDTSRGELQRDLVATMNQEVDGTLSLLEGTATKGGSAVAVTKLRKQLSDVTKLNITAARDEAGRIVQIPPKRLEEIYMGLNRMKQAVGRESGFGIPPHLRTEAQREFGGLYEKLRVSLEDEAVWGAEAGSNQRVLNEVFSTDFKRSNDFANRYTVGLDEAKGVPIPEADAEKLKNGLLRKLGSEADSQQALKSTDTWVSRNHRRITALEEHGDLTPEQLKLVREGREALTDFNKVLEDAKKESTIVAKLEQQQLEEQGKGLGGMLGLGMDIMTRPLTTMSRLAQVRSTARSVEKAIENGFAKLMKSKAVGTTETVAPRAKDVVAKEIGDIRELAGNPLKMQDRVNAFVGDLAKHAPKIAEEVKATAARAILYLSNEAPPATVRMGFFGVHNAKPRYSDQQISEWETKRTAALGAANGGTAPESIIVDMKRGKLNREAIQAIEFVSPKLFAQMQDLAMAELERMEARGLLDKMPYQQKAAIATLLKMPPDGTWKPDFIGLMQAAKVAPPPQPAPTPGPPTTSKRAIKLNTDIYATETSRIEGKVL